MTFEVPVNRWLYDFRKAYKTDPNFKVEGWLFISKEHVLEGYPCRPISEPLIERLFFRDPVRYEVSTHGISVGNRAFIYMNDTDTAIRWRFTLDFSDQHINSRPVRGMVVSAYPKDLNNLITYPDKRNCCFYNSDVKPCNAFLLKAARMP